MLVYKSTDGTRKTINGFPLGNRIMEIVMWYFDTAARYAFREAQSVGKNEAQSFQSPVSLNRPVETESSRQMERELAMNFLARRMAPKLA